MTSDLTRLTADLNRAADTIDDKIAPIVKKGATDIANNARDSVRDSSQYDEAAREYAVRNMGYDEPTKRQLSIEIGYSRLLDDRFALALEYGSADAAPGDHVGQGLRRELNDFTRIVGAAGAGWIKRALVGRWR